MSCFLAFWSDDFHNTVFSVLRASTRWAACETIQGPGLRLKKGENGEPSLAREICRELCFFNFADVMMLWISRGSRDLLCWAGRSLLIWKNPDRNLGSQLARIVKLAGFSVAGNHKEEL